MSALQQVLMAYGAAAAPSITSPDTLAGLTMWIDGTDTNTLLNASAGSVVTTDGASVAMAKSKGSINRCLYVASSTFQPVLKTGVVNGKSVLRFNGVNSLMQLFAQTAGTVGSALNASDLITVSQAVSISAISIVGADAAQALVYNNDAVFRDSGQYLGLFASNVDASNVKLSAYNWTGTSQQADVNLAKNTWAIVTTKHLGGSLSIRVNAGSWASIASGNTTSIGNTVTEASGAGAKYLEFDLAHQAFYNSAPADSDIHAVETWMAAQLGFVV